MYLVGEPILEYSRMDSFIAPMGQLPLCLGIYTHMPQEKAVERMRLEYLSIIAAMLEMGLQFRIVYAHKNHIDRLALTVCMQMGCRLAGFSPDFFPAAIAYPRDFAVILPQCLLVCPGIRLVNENKEGWRLLQSPLGEGGMVLKAGNKVLVPMRLCNHEGKAQSRLISEADVAPIKSSGMDVEFMPNPASGEFNGKGISLRTSFSDHLDRASSLVQDRSGAVHLLIDHSLYTIRMINEQSRTWKVIHPMETFELLKRRYQSFGIEVHRAPPANVPYGLNLLQVDDGRVLMTSGDPDLIDFVGSIVGNTKVVATEVPIIHFPIYKRAGIRCLVTEMPEIIMKKVPTG